MEMIMELKELFEYRDGLLFNRVNRNPRAMKGQQAGVASKGGSGYRSLQYNGVKTSAHRVIWEMFNGAIPEGMQVDHINQDKSDDRIENLRLVNQSQNQFNSSKSKGFIKRGNRYTAYIATGRKSRNLGAFDTEEEAHEAYIKARKEIAGEFAPA